MGNQSSKQDETTAIIGVPSARDDRLLRASSFCSQPTFMSSRMMILSNRGGNLASMSPRIRRSLGELEDLCYNRGDPEPLEKLMQAWKCMKDMDPIDLKKHFFQLSALDIEAETLVPEAGHHGNVLFPTWHRVYLLKLEQLLQSFEPTVTLPFWDECGNRSRKMGLPRSLTDATFTFSSGEVIPNPLRTTLLPDVEFSSSDKTPVGVTEDKSSTSDEEILSGQDSGVPTNDPVRRLNQTILKWLNDGHSGHRNITSQYKKCMEAPNYMLFSNVTSQDQYNSCNHCDHVVSLEAVHNDVHLAVSGLWDGSDYDIVHQKTHEGKFNLDPLFFMHCCFVDYVFWKWQKKNNLHDLSALSKKERKSVLDGADAGSQLEYPVESYSDKVGNEDRNATMLTLHSPLMPFAYPDGQRKGNKSNSKFYYRSKDVIDIEKQLGYTYGIGSFDDDLEDTLEESTRDGDSLNNSIRVPTCSKKLVVSGLDYVIAKSKAVGKSLLVEAHAEWKGPKGITKECLGYETVVVRKSHRRTSFSSMGGKSSVSIPLALGLDPLEYARSVTLRISVAPAPDKPSRRQDEETSSASTSSTSSTSSAVDGNDASPESRTYNVKVKQSEDNRNIYEATIEPSEVLKEEESSAFVLAKAS